MQLRAQPVQSSLILEAGATKTALSCQLANGQVHRLTLPGINANVQTLEQAAEVLSALPEQWRKAAYSVVWYYGAGLEPQQRRVGWQALLEQVFPQAAQVEVQTDLLAAVRALWGAQPGQAAILGTGSNYGAYDGAQITLQLGGHGHLLGDEGSGADLGRRLLKGLLEGYFHPEEQQKLEAFLKKSTPELKAWVYAQPLHNRALAALAPAVVEFQSWPRVHELVQTAFQAFLNTTALRNPQAEQTPLGAVGSLAHFLQHPWRTILQKNHLTPGPLEPHPLQALERLHFFPSEF